MSLRHAWKLVPFLFVALVGNLVQAVDHTKDSLEKVKEMLESKKAILVDVREKSEWDAGHIQGAKHIAMSAIRDSLTQDELLKLMPKEKIVYLYCAGGYRSLDVAEKLEKVHPNLRALKQGYVPLLKAGFRKAESEEKPTSDKK